MTDFMHADDLGYAINMEYPGIVRGTDYWVCHPVDDSPERVQRGDGFIAKWVHPTFVQPDADALRAIWFKWKTESVHSRTSYDTRCQRDYRLSLADPKVYIAEDRGDTATAQAWRTYRQALRDLPTQPGFPFNVVWPDQPT